MKCFTNHASSWRDNLTKSDRELGALKPIWTFHMVSGFEIISMSEGERGKASHRTPKGMQIARVTVAETESLGDIGWSGEVDASLGTKFLKQKKPTRWFASKPSIQ